MKFRYKKFGPFLRPVIPVKLTYENRSVWYEVLVDSGADLCIFDAEIGEVLGLVVEDGEPQRVSGVAGQTSTYYVHKVVMEVGGHPRKIKAGFLPNVAGACNYGIVGQNGFFDQFKVTFDFQKEEIELRECL